MIEYSNISHGEVRERTPGRGIFLGMAVLVASIAIGKSFIFFGGVLLFSLVMTLVWRKSPISWVSLVSTTAATPVLIAKYQLTCNLVFAFWALIFNNRYLFRLPKWVYALTVLSVFGFFTSSINWLNDIKSIVAQLIHTYNFLFPPILLLPFIYVRMRDSKDHAVNLKSLLFALIVPATLILLSAKFFGTVMNAWEASQHTNTSAEGFYMYRLGKAYINFSRTDVGFILSALICACTAVIISSVGPRQRIIAGACLAANAFLLLSTASFGSFFATLCGLTAIFIVQLRSINIVKLIGSMVAIVFMLFLVYALLPAKTHKYLEQRYEHRVVNKDTDRLVLWTIGTNYFLNHPEGIGHSLGVPEGRSTIFVHNEYLTKLISYGIFGGLAYLLLIAWLLYSFISMRKIVQGDPSGLAICLAGLGVLIAASVNSMTDHLSGSRVNYNVIWSLIWYCYFCSCAGKNEAAPEGYEAFPL
jgi:O-antigen ligase